MEFITLIVLAMVGEAVWETLKMLWPNGKVSVDKVGALLVSLVITLGTNINIMHLLGLSLQWNLLGVVLTAILISRGANFIHDLIGQITSIKSEVSVKNIANSLNENSGKKY